MARTRISIGFLPVRMAIMSIAFRTMLVARALLPPATPGLIMSSIRRSTTFMVDFLNRWCSWRPLVWGRSMGLAEMYRLSPGSFASIPAVGHLPKTLTSGSFFSSLLKQTQRRLVAAISVF